MITIPLVLKEDIFCAVALLILIAYWIIAHMGQLMKANIKRLPRICLALMRHPLSLRENAVCFYLSFQGTAGRKQDVGFYLFQQAFSSVHKIKDQIDSVL